MGAGALKLSLVIDRHRHLKWKALDPLEHFLMVLCGISIAGFTFSVFLDVVTRELGSAWLWLQLVTTGFFAWGVFIGMATATRRIDHLNLVEITKRMSGPRRGFLEITNRVVILLVGLAMVVFGFQNFLNDLGSFRAYLGKQVDAIRQKTGCSDVQFRLALEDGKLKLKARPLAASPRG